MARLPWIVVALPAGRHSDLHGYRPVASAGLVSKVLGVAILAVAIWSESIALTAVAGFVVVSGEVAFETAVHTSLISVFPENSRTKGNSQLYAWQAANGQFVGPSLGGALFSLGGSLFLVLPVALHLVTMKLRGMPRPSSRRHTPSPDEPPLLRSLLKGFGPLFSDRALAGTTLIGTVSMMAYGLWGAVFVLFVTSDGGLGLGGWAFGLLMACPALGSLPGAFVARQFLRRCSALGCVLAMIVGQLGLFLPVALNGSVALVVTGLVVYGLGLSAWNSGILAYRQHRVPASVYGRVTSAYRVASWGASPIGALLGAVLASTAPLTTSFMVGVGLVLLQLGALPWLGELRTFREAGTS